MAKLRPYRWWLLFTAATAFCQDFIRRPIVLPQTVFNPPAGQPPGPNQVYVMRNVANYTFGRVAVIDGAGNITSAPGAITDCVTVGGTNTACSGGGTGVPAGSNTYVQFNNNGQFGGSSRFAWYDNVALLDVNQYLSASAGFRSRNSGYFHASFFGTGTNLPYVEYSDSLIFLSAPYSQVSAGTGNGVLYLNQSVTNGVNYLGISNAATGAPPVLAPVGPDVNIDLSLTGKGTGKVRLGNVPHKWPNADGTANQALVTDGAGNLSFATIGLGTVTGSNLTANMPVIGAGGTAITVGSVQGNTTKFVSYSGAAPTSGDYAKFDVNGNLIDGGTAPGTGYATVQNAGVSLTQRATINFTGTVTCTDNAVSSRTDCNGASGGGGTVTSVALSMPGEFSVSGSPITGGGTLAVSKANQSANQVYAGPSSGGPAAPSFRALVAADIPTGIPAANISGTAVTQSRQILNTDGTISGTGNLSADLTLGVVPNSVNEKVQVLNASTLVGTRKAINFIPGTNVTMNVVDNGASDRVDVTLNATAGAGGYATIQNLGTPLTQRSTVNFAGSINCVDNASAGRTDCTGSSGGTSTVAGLQDCKVTWTSSTVLTVLAPCSVRVGGTTTLFSQSATLTLSGTLNGAAWIEFDKTASPLSLRVNNGGLSITCTGMNCINTSGNAFDSFAIPLFKWTATSGTWDAAGGTDYRAMFNSDVQVQGGLGIIATASPTQTTIAVDTAAVGLRVAVPATSATACTSGQWASDANYFYYCYADNNWRRIAGSSF